MIETLVLSQADATEKILRNCDGVEEPKTRLLGFGEPTNGDLKIDA